MPTASELSAAVDAGIITPEQAARLAALEAQGAAAPADTLPATDADDEIIHFARGFQDVFLTIGITLLLVGAGIAGPLFLGAAGGAFAGAVLAFALAWYFARQRMLVLPSIALALGFTVFIGVGVGTVLGGEGWANLFPRWGGAASPLSLLGGGFAAAVAAGLFFILFRLPFALALIAVSAIYFFFGALAIWLGADAVAPIAMVYLLAIGLVTFAVAMAFDLSDPNRRTLRADNAFWLHLVAAPMIVHSLISLLVRNGRTSFTVEESLFVIAIVIGLGLVALIIDRRAMLVAGIGYLAFAIARLLTAADVEGTGVLAATLVFVGATVVLLGAGWRPIRAVLLNLLPKNAIRRLPPVPAA